MKNRLQFVSRGWILVGVILAITGCGDNMADQQRVDALEASAFLPEATYRDPLPPGTVPRGEPWNDLPFITGKSSPSAYLETAPIGYTRETIQRGEELFHIHCVVCHGPAGYGDGIVVRRGFPKPPSYHTDRLRGMPDGYLFDVITNGYGVMAAYGGRIEPQERWQIVTYLRALQLSQFADYNELPAGIRAQLDAVDR